MTNACGNFFKKKSPLKIVGMVFGGIILAGLMAFLFGWVIMLLWNWLMPEIFGLGTINYWQGFGIFFLAKIIFGFGGEHTSDGNKSKKKDRPIRDEISKEIRKEIRKEFAKENGHDFNDEYDDKYEAWWSREGKESFDKYMNKDKAEEETEL
ncbi:MAG: hypothetical protein JXN10_05290 [Clostridia bacterium]|nr:hypothetical protein [Clostridia bacterium]MBN2882921.1 hypothetical protein [Clostridia bacterium]